MIVAAAIKHDGIVFTGARHNEIIHYLIQLGYQKPIPNNEQGFIDDNGKYWNRHQSRVLAKRSNQLNWDHRRVLTSEDLW